MKKSPYILALLLASSTLSSCGNNTPNSSNTIDSSLEPTTSNTSSNQSEGESETSDDNPGDTTSGTIIRHNDFNAVLSYDYSNVTIAEYDSDEDVGDGIVYNVGQGKYVSYYTVLGEQVHQFFADYNDSNYVYWEYESEGGRNGWINYNDKYETSLSLENSAFYMPNLLNNITKDDVTYYASIGMYVVKNTSLNKFSRTVLKHAWNHDPEIVYISVETDDNNLDRINRIYAFDDEEKGAEGPYVILEFSNYGKTTTPWTFPELPNENNIYNYYEITGEEYVPNIYPEELEIELVGEFNKDDEHDVVLEIGETVEVALTILPENYNRTPGIFYWRPSASDYMDDDGNPTEEYYNQPALFGFKQNWTSGHRYLTGRTAGEIEIYVEYWTTDNKSIYSNKLSVKVNDIPEQDLSESVYNFEFKSDVKEYNDPIWGSDSGYYQTSFEAINLQQTASFSPDYEITGWHATTLEGRYTEAFDDVDKVLSISPTSASATAEGLDSYVDFNLGDQDVSSINFYYSLHRGNQLGYFTSNLKEFSIYTSSDGNEWNLEENLTSKSLEAMAQESSAVDLSPKYYSLDFANKVNYVRIFISAKSFGQHFSVVFNSISFNNDEITHVEKPYVAVTNVSINEIESAVVRINNTLELESVINPNNATNKKVYWTSSDHTIATVSPHKDGSVTINALKEGLVKITVFTDEIDSDTNHYSDEIEIRIIGDATLPEEVDGITYSLNNGTSLFTAKFSTSESSMSFTYFDGSNVYQDKLYLVNEESGRYTFKSDDSYINLRFDNDTIIIVNYGTQSNIDGANIAPGTTLTKSSN